MKRHTNRRRHVRYTMEPMYTPVSVRTRQSRSFDNRGHAYDISESGARFELDRLVKPGTPITMRITIPTAGAAPGRSVVVSANVVWTEDEDEPGPVRTAAVFTRFPRAADRERLVRSIASGRYRQAA